MMRRVLVAAFALALLHTHAHAQGTPLLTLADTTLFPEGIVRDDLRGRWLVSSVRQRTVVAVDDAGRITRFARDLPADVGAILGMRIDAARGALFAASAAVPPMLRYTPADTLRAEVLEFDLASGALRRRIALPPAARQRAPGDIAIGPDGTLYVSDGLAARLYVIPPQGDVRVITSPFIASLQGMVFTPDGRALIAADYRHGLIRIPLAGTGAITQAADTITQITDSAGRKLQGLDALVWHGDALIATYNGRLPGRVVRITLTADLRRIAAFTTLETLANAGEPTLGEVHGDAFIYIANSPWSAFDESGARRPGTTLAPPAIRRLPLTP
jgi:DNA-binding beta-propeller fold protein YncE